jgi:hypothetical protein
MPAPVTRSPFAPVISAFLLYLFAAGYGVAAAAVVPWLLELMERSPRLGALGWVALLSSPIALVAQGHHWTHAAMDRFDAEKKARGALPGAASVRAGFFAWAAMVFASVASAFLLLAIFPPPPGEGALDAIVRVAANPRVMGTVHAVLWVGVAALLYYVDRAAEERRAAP